MSDKPIASEVANEAVKLGKDTISEMVEKGTGGLINPKQTTQTQQQKQPNQDDQALKNIAELEKKEQELKEKGIPDATWMLRNAEKEKESLEEEKEKKRQEEQQEIVRKHNKEVADQEKQAAVIGDLGAMGHKQTTRDQFVRKGTKETPMKQGM